MCLLTFTFLSGLQWSSSTIGQNSLLLDSAPLNCHLLKMFWFNYLKNRTFDRNKIFEEYERPSVHIIQRLFSSLCKLLCFCSQLLSLLPTSFPAKLTDKFLDFLFDSCKFLQSPWTEACTTARLVRWLCPWFSWLQNRNNHHLSWTLI